MELSWTALLFCTGGRFGVWSIDRSITIETADTPYALSRDEPAADRVHWAGNSNRNMAASSLSPWSLSNDGRYDDDDDDDAVAAAASAAAD